jgi:pimeloyl-ACP methyl ester carboxylesterase
MATGTFTNDGLVFDAYVEGPDDGEPVVLLHGFPQDASAYNELVGNLVQHGYRTYRYDQRGYSPGARPRAVRDYRLGKLVGDLKAFVREYEIGPFHLIAHDWGGVVGWHVAGRYPEMLRSYTSLSMPHLAAYRKALLTSSQIKSSVYTLFFQLPMLPERKLLEGDGERLRRGLRSIGLPDQHAAHYAARMREPGALSAALSWYRAAGRRVWELTASRSRVPTLYIWGSKDPALRRKAAETTGDFVSAPYRFEVLEGAGHWLPEANAEEIAPIIEGFLKGL